MSDVAADTVPTPEVVGKKRKRTGKEREERKKAAIQAQLDAKAQALVQGNDEEQSQLLTGAPQEGDEPAPAPGAGTEGESSVKASVDIEKAAKRIPQALKSLHPIFKQAKTFETRRLIKKIKFLRSKADTQAEVTDLEGQLQLIHQIQLHPLAQSHLLLKLRKHHLLKPSPLPASLVEPLTPSTPSLPHTSTSTAPALVGKVENRLCSAKVVADAIKDVISWIVGEDGAKLVLGGKGLKATLAKREKKAAMNPARAARIAADSDNDNDDEDADEDDDELIPRFVVEGESDADIGSDDEVVQQDFAADAAGWESGSVSGGDDDIEADDGDSDSDAIPLPPTKRNKVAAQPKHAKAAKAEKTSSASKKGEGVTSSMFLPSLAAGFTRGDDGDSDPDMDFDPDGTIGTKKAERKNRRGQRARQAIWEKKYGGGAKHVVKARKEEEEQRDQVAKTRQDREFAKKLGRDAGWGAKAPTASVPTSARPAVAAAPIARSTSTPAFTPANKAAPATSADPAAKLHPSWEAARLRKQKMGMVAAAQAAKPNKIVFD